MASGINKVILIGNLGTDPEVRYSASGDAVTTVSIATSESWKDKNSGEKKEITEWHKVVFFKRLAEIAAEYLKKGAKIFVEGKLQTKKYQNKDGHDQYSTQIVAKEMQMLDRRGEALGQQPSTPQQASLPHQQPTTQNQTTIDNLNDDIPF